MADYTLYCRMLCDSMNTGPAKYSAHTSLGTLTLNNPRSESGTEEYDDECAEGLCTFPSFNSASFYTDGADHSHSPIRPSPGNTPNWFNDDSSPEAETARTDRTSCGYPSTTQDELQHERVAPAPPTDMSRTQPQ